MRRSLPNLPVNDGLRALACLILVVWHSVLTNIPEDPSPAQHLWVLPLGVLARESVLVFIILSGLLLGRHWSGIGSRAAFTSGAVTYAKRRLWRLVPPYWAALTFVIVCMVAFGLREPSGTHWDSGLPLTWARVLSNYTLMTDLVFEVPLSHQFWTVATELHLYALGPLVVLLVRRRTAVIAVGALISAAAVVLAPHYHAPYLPFIFMATFWIGLQRQQVTTQPLKATIRLWWPIAVASVGLIAVVLSTDGLPESSRNFFLADALTAPVFCLWLFHVDFAATSGRLGRVLEWAPFVWVGQRSYSIYLMHGVMIELIWRAVFAPLGASDRPLDIVALILASVPASIAAGVVLYRLVELPSARKSASMRPRREPAVDSATRGSA